MFSELHLAGSFALHAAGGWELSWCATGREGAEIDVSSEDSGLIKIQEKFTLGLDWSLSFGQSWLKANNQNICRCWVYCM